MRLELRAAAPFADDAPVLAVLAELLPTTVEVCVTGAESGVDGVDGELGDVAVTVTGGGETTRGLELPPPLLPPLSSEVPSSLESTCRRRAFSDVTASSRNVQLAPGRSSIVPNSLPEVVPRIVVLRSKPPPMMWKLWRVEESLTQSL